MSFQVENSICKLKTPSVLVVVDISQGKAVFELKIAPVAGVVACRFCGIEVEGALSIAEAVCSNEECQEKWCRSCRKIHSCGHACGGVFEENICLLCLHPNPNPNPNPNSRRIYASRVSMAAIRL